MTNTKTTRNNRKMTATTGILGMHVAETLGWQVAQDKRFYLIMNLVSK